MNIHRALTVLFSTIFNARNDNIIQTDVGLFRRQHTSEKIVPVCGKNIPYEIGAGDILFSICVYRWPA